MVRTTRKANISEASLVQVAQDAQHNVTATMRYLQTALTSTDQAAVDEAICYARHNLRGLYEQMRELERAAHT